MFRTTNRSSFLPIFGALLLLFSACNALTKVPTRSPAATQSGSAEATAILSENTGQDVASLTLDVSGVAQDITSQVVATVPPSANGPWWEAQLTLQGYPIADHLMKPQIFVYPVKGLDVNEVASQVPENLKTLVQSQQPGKNLPYLPPYNAAQVMYAQVKYLDFKNGKGVRYLTQFDQAPLPINNHELLYTFQGLTIDGRYYVAVVLPVNLAGLPANENVTDSLPPDLMNDFPKYLVDIVDTLNQQPANAFTPDLSKLDAMIQSIEVK